MSEEYLRRYPRYGRGEKYQRHLSRKALRKSAASRASRRKARGRRL